MSTQPTPQPDVVTQMVRDPDFSKMAVSEQRKALAAHDPIFQQAGDDAIGQFVQAHQAAAPQAQQPPQQPGFFKRLGQSLGIPTSSEEAQAMAPHSWKDIADVMTPGGMAAKLLTNYGQTAGRGVQQGFQEAIESGQNARQLGQQGRLTPGELLKQQGKAAAGAMHATLQATPVVGPSLETYGSDISQGNYAGAAGGGLGIGAQIMGPKLVETGIPYVGEGVARTGGALTRNAVPIGNTVGYGGAAVTAGSELLHGRPVSAGATALLSPLAANRAIKLTRVAGGGLQDLGNAIGRTPRPIEGPAPRPTAAPVQSAAPAESATQMPVPESAPVQSPATPASMEGYYGKTAAKSNLRGNQRQLAGPTASTAPNPSTPTPQAPHPPEIMQILQNPGEISDADMSTLQNYFAKQRLSKLLSGGAAPQQPSFSLADMLQKAVGQ